MQPLVVGLALCAGLSASVVELAKHIASEPANAYVLAFPILLLLSARSAPRVEPHRVAGLAWIALAIAVEVTALRAGADRFARIAIPMGIVGYLSAFSSVPFATAALAFFVVPVPSLVAKAVPLQSVWGALAASVVGPLNGALTVTEWDSGARLIAMFGGLGWFSVARTGGTWQRAMRTGARIALLGLPVQLFGVLLAAVVAQYSSSLAQALLTHGIWLVCATAYLAVLGGATRHE
jgi:hypothetical protein